MTGVAPSHIMS
jgi:hypothetical protein